MINSCKITTFFWPKQAFGAEIRTLFIKNHTCRNLKPRPFAVHL